MNYIRKVLRRLLKSPQHVQRFQQLEPNLWVGWVQPHLLPPVSKVF
ncbi:MAG: hypothetical protein WD151_16665 [Phycisphaeraceae bacterium]